MLSVPFMCSIVRVMEKRWQSRVSVQKRGRHAVDLEHLDCHESTTGMLSERIKIAQPWFAGPIVLISTTAARSSR